MKTLPNEPITAIRGFGITDLTKLEYAAIQAMKGILANGSDYYSKRADRVSELAVIHAKALFDELNKEQ